MERATSSIDAAQEDFLVQPDSAARGKQQGYRKGRYTGTMAEIIKTYIEQWPATRFIGKRYSTNDMKDGNFSQLWQTWFANNWFEPLDALAVPGIDNGYLGLSRCFGDHFDYWIGVLAPESTIVPEGYECLDIPASKVGVSWIQGEDGPELYNKHEECVAALEKADLGTPQRGEDGTLLSFERYNCPRFTETDGNGLKILDYGIVYG